MTDGGQLSKDLHEAVNDLGRYRSFERVLASVCLFTPLVFIALEGWPNRDSISAYYNIPRNQWFYFLLTAAVMLFLSNALIWKQHIYNAGLAFGLSLIVLFNHTDYKPIHWLGVIVFFAGNAAVIAFFSRGPRRGVKLAFLAVMAVALAGVLLDWWTLFWTEWLSMAAIAAHFLLDSIPRVRYQAAPPEDGPSLTA